LRCWDGDGSKPWYLVNPKIAGKWMFIPLKYTYRYWPIPWWNMITSYYPLVMTNSSPWYRWPIEIDDLPTKNGDFPWLC
jgi:hypothetical protein